METYPQPHKNRSYLVQRQKEKQTPQTHLRQTRNPMVKLTALSGRLTRLGSELERTHEKVRVQGQSHQQHTEITLIYENSAIHRQQTSSTPRHH